MTTLILDITDVWRKYEVGKAKLAVAARNLSCSLSVWWVS